MKNLHLFELVIKYNGPLYFLAGVVTTTAAFTISLTLAALLTFIFIGTAMCLADEHRRRQFRAEMAEGRAQFARPGRHHAPTA